MKGKYVLSTSGSFMGFIAEELEKEGRTLLVAHNLKQAKNLYQFCERVVIPGGSDIAPELYGEKPTWSNTLELSSRDETEAWIINRALKDRKAILGICRGCQMLAVMTGGKLHQDIQKDSGVEHGTMTHAIIIQPETRLSAWTQSATATVNSYHHQAISRLTRNWRPSAFSTDGVVEAIEHLSRPAVGVQFHPEAMAKDVGIFHGFITMKTVKPTEAIESTLKPWAYVEPVYTNAYEGWGGYSYKSTTYKGTEYWENGKWKSYEPNTDNDHYWRDMEEKLDEAEGKIVDHKESMILAAMEAIRDNDTHLDQVEANIVLLYRVSATEAENIVSLAWGRLAEESDVKFIEAPVQPPLLTAESSDVPVSIDKPDRASGLDGILYEYDEEIIQEAIKMLTEGSTLKETEHFLHIFYGLSVGETQDIVEAVLTTYGANKQGG